MSYLLSAPILGTGTGTGIAAGTTKEEKGKGKGKRRGAHQLLVLGDGGGVHFRPGPGLVLSCSVRSHRLTEARNETRASTNRELRNYTTTCV